MVYHEDAGIINNELVNSPDDYGTECGSALLVFLPTMLPTRESICLPMNWGTGNNILKDRKKACKSAELDTHQKSRTTSPLLPKALMARVPTCADSLKCNLAGRKYAYWIVWLYQICQSPVMLGDYLPVLGRVRVWRQNYIEFFARCPPHGRFHTIFRSVAASNNLPSRNPLKRLAELGSIHPFLQPPLRICFQTASANNLPSGPAFLVSWIFGLIDNI